MGEQAPNLNNNIDPAVLDAFDRGNEVDAVAETTYGAQFVDPRSQDALHVPSAVAKVEESPADPSLDKVVELTTRHDKFVPSSVNPNASHSVYKTRQVDGSPAMGGVHRTVKGPDGRVETYTQKFSPEGAQKLAALTLKHLEQRTGADTVVNKAA